MENHNELKVVINGRTFEDVKKDINETASLGYDQVKASQWRGIELARMLEIYKKRADKLNKKQENIIGPKIKYVAL